MGAVQWVAPASVPSSCASPHIDGNGACGWGCGESTGQAQVFPIDPMPPQQSKAFSDPNAWTWETGANGEWHSSNGSVDQPVHGGEYYDAIMPETANAAAATTSWEATSSDPTSDFIQKWGLDGAAHDWLLSLSDGIRNTIMAEFAPRCLPHDVPRMLYAFGRSIATSRGGVSLQHPPQNSSSLSTTPSEGLAHEASSAYPFREAWQGGADGSNAINDFAQHWSLDDSAISWLHSLEVGVRTTVMAEFAPRCNTRDIPKMLYAFGRSVAMRHTAEGQMPADVKNFAQTWELDSAATGWLLSLAPEVQSVVIQEFAPKEGTGNIIAKLRAFARSIETRYAETGVDAVAPSAPAMQTEAFAQHWQLEENSRALLYSLPPDVQATVVEQFDPKGESVNVNGKFIAFARSVLGRRQYAHPQGYVANAVDDFAQCWGLDEDTREYLRSLPPDVRVTVIEQFDPAAGTQDINAKLRGFARGIAATARWSGASAYTSTWAPAHASGHVAPSKARTDVKAVPCQTLVWEPADNASEWPADDQDPSEAEFLAHWGLTGNTAAKDILQGLLPAVRDRVMREFAPAPGTRDVLRLLAGFANSVAKAAGSEAPPQSPHGNPAPQAGNSQADSASTAADQDPEEFATRWQLDEGSRALLRGLSDEAKATVMAEFNPRGFIHDISGKFCAFARSVAACVGDQRGVKRVAEWAPENQPPWQR